MAYMKDSTGKRLDDFEVVQAAPMAVATKRYDRARNVYNLKPQHLFRTRAKLAQARAGTGICKIAAVGHSMVAGVGATTGTQDWPTVLADILNSHGIPRAGSNLVTGNRGSGLMDARWSWGAGWGSFGGSSTLMANSTTTNAAVMTSDKAGTVVDIWFYKTSTSSAYSVVIDGGAPVTVTPSGSNNTPFLHTITGLANTTHTVSVTRSGGGAGYILGAEVRQTSGVSIFNGGIGGSRVTTLTETQLYGTTAFASSGSYSGPNRTWGADLILMGPIITNDAFAGTNVATWKADHQTAITRARTFSGTYTQASDLVLVADTPVAGIDQSGYRTALYELADTNDLPLIDMFDRWGSYTLSNAYGLMDDGTHPNRNGYAEEAAAVMGALGLI